MLNDDGQLGKEAKEWEEQALYRSLQIIDFPGPNCQRLLMGKNVGQVGELVKAAENP